MASLPLSTLSLGATPQRATPRTQDPGLKPGAPLLPQLAFLGFRRAGVLLGLKSHVWVVFSVPCDSFIPGSSFLGAGRGCWPWHWLCFALVGQKI